MGRWNKSYALCTCMVFLFALFCLLSPVYVRGPVPETGVEDKSGVVELLPSPPAVNTEGIRVQTKVEPQPVTVEPPVEAVTETEEPGPWRVDVPLSADLQAALLSICEEAGIDPLLALGLIDTESGFQVDIVSATGDYGLCQLNYRYFDPSMTPEENMAAGIGLLADNIARYGTVAAGLTAYNRGHDDGSRAYANAVLNKARAWGYTDD